MSLIHWWPLNGDTKDYGTKSTDLTNNGATVDNSGKIGKCYSFNGNKYMSVTNPITSSSTDFSIALWFKKVESYTTLISARTDSGGKGLLIHWENNTMMFDDGSRLQFSQELSLNTWYHLVAVRSSTQGFKKVYINGVEKGSTTTVGNLNNLSTTLGIGKDLTFGIYFSGNLNDVRIYDHALSLKEVKEISKALILDYNFEDGNLTPYGNVYYGTDYTKGSLSTGNNWTKTGPFIDEEGDTYYTYKMNRTGTGQNWWPSLAASTFPFTIGDKYLYSCYVRVRECSNMNLSLRAARISNDWVTSTVQIVNSDLADNTWKYKTVFTVIPETFNRSGTIVTSNPLWEAFTSNLNETGVVYTCEFDIKKVSVINCTVHDNSGYNNNGTLLGANSTYGYQVLEGGPVGTQYINSPVGNYIDNTSRNFDKQELTYSVWFKHYGKNGTTSTFLFTNGRADGSEYGYGVEIANDTQLRIRYGNATYNITANKGVWHCLTVSIKNDTQSIYLNGNFIANSVATVLPTYGNGAGLSLGSFYYSAGHIYQSNTDFAEFKIYATALSAEDVLALYQRKASIDKTGILYSGEFIEDNSNAEIASRKQITKTSVLQEGNSKVQIFGGYTELEYLESTGTQYIDTGIKLKYSSEIEMTACWTRSDSDYETLIGSRGGADYNIRLYSNLTNKRVFWASTNVNCGSATANKIYNIKVLGTTTSKIAYFNEEIYTFTSGTTAATQNAWLFAINNSGSIYRPAKAKMYNCKIYDNGTLVRNFVPVKRNKDNVLGMYDTVEHKFYTNSGTGTFTSGTELGQLSLISTNQIKEV